MCDLQFEWDANKAQSNVRKHGVTFEDAKSVFFDEYARVIPDPDGGYGEERFVILGQSKAHHILVVCHCYRGVDDKIRIISARKAGKRERNQYKEFRYA